MTWTTTLKFGGCNPTCLPFSPCDPQVICFSPNGETWPLVNTPDGEKSTGKTIWFGDTGTKDFTADNLHAARVQLAVEFEIASPLWQVPARPANYGGTSYEAVEDQGRCLADDFYDATNPNKKTIFYAPRPRVEALCSIPGVSNGAGANRDEPAPALPTDDLGQAVTWPAMVQPANPGTVTVAYNIPYFHWVKMDYELQNCQGCRFSAAYTSCV